MGPQARIPTVKQRIEPATRAATHRGRAVEKIVDPDPRFGVVGKLTLRKCARPGDRAGLFLMACVAGGPKPVDDGP